jgi:hydrophobic/amphiphilic exporter-1 (mainly G- bacteria), HAE1 family
VRESVLEGGGIRLRPILVTTAAMVFGMVPLALGIGESSDERAPIGQAVIGGVFASTLLHPARRAGLYTYLEVLRARAAAWKARRANPAKTLSEHAAERSDPAKWC